MEKRKIFLAVLFMLTVVLFYIHTQYNGTDDAGYITVEFPQATAETAATTAEAVPAMAKVKTEKTVTSAVKTTTAALPRITESEPQLPQIEFPLDINTVTKDELLCVPGVNDEIADSIISLRELIKYYSHIYELAYIDVLSDAQVAELMQYLTVREVSAD